MSDVEVWQDDPPAAHLGYSHMQQLFEARP